MLESGAAARVESRPMNFKLLLLILLVAAGLVFLGACSGEEKSGSPADDMEGSAKQAAQDASETATQAAINMNCCGGKCETPEGYCCGAGCCPDLPIWDS